MRKYILLLISCLFVCGACQDDDTLNEVKGGLSIYLTDGVAETRSLPAALSDELKQQFQILLSRSRDGEMKVEYNDLLKDFGASRVFPVGTYKAAASFGANKNIALDEPYYYGEQHDIQIEKGKASTITIGCKVANALAAFTIVNPDNFNRVMKNYYVEIAVGGESVTWRPEDTTNPYFKAGSQVSFILKGTSVVTDEELSYALTPIEAVEAGMKYNYKLKLQPSNVGFDITTEAQKEPITINETVPEAWLPKAKLAAEGFDEQHILSYTETADAPEKAAITFTALRPVQDVEFTLNFADSHYTHLNKTYVLSTLSEEDRKALTDAGVVLPALDGTSTSGALDVRNMTPVLLTGDAGENVDNQIKVKVKANNRWSDEGTYTIRTVKPIFRVGYYPGNVWTKEFTINPLSQENVETGNINKFTNIQYEYSADGSNWTAFSEDMRKEGLTPGTTYFVRAKYRGGIMGEVVEVKTYEALSIPNSNLDDGYDTTYPKNGNPLYTFKGGWIGTRNPLTCHTDGVNAFYVSKSSTLPVVDGERNVAHLMTLGWGAGNTCSFGNKDNWIGNSVINHISAGIICVGDYVASEDIVHPKSAYIRPTSMTFVYKASPYKDDEYLIEGHLENISNNVESIIGKVYLKSGTAYSSYQSQTLTFEYDATHKELPITHVKIIFKAGTKEDRSHLEDKFKDAKMPYNDAYIIGTQLWLDSFTLNYDK